MIYTGSYSDDNHYGDAGLNGLPILFPVAKCSGDLGEPSEVCGVLLCPCAHL